MYLFTIRSRINPKSELTKKFRNIGGAYVNCYVSFKDFAAAGTLGEVAHSPRRLDSGEKNGSAARIEEALQNQEGKAILFRRYQIRLESCLRDVASRCTG